MINNDGDRVMTILELAITVQPGSNKVDELKSKYLSYKTETIRCLTQDYYPNSLMTDPMKLYYCAGIQQDKNDADWKAQIYCVGPKIFPQYNGAAFANNTSMHLMLTELTQIMQNDDCGFNATDTLLLKAHNISNNEAIALMHRHKMSKDDIAISLLDDTFSMLL